MSRAHIEIRRDGPLFRIAVNPETALPKGWNRPQTFSSHPLARMGAKLMSDASGLPVVDMAKAGN
ncbi:MAG: hypothetical protein J0H88_13785 [Sphingomonadales bacterium]|nr:hypothetical protein [Sphingomonadales bacterium]